MCLRARRLVVMGMVLSLAVTAAAVAQSITGTLTGSVKDASGLPMPGVGVTLTSESRGTTMPAAFTNASGDFVVVNIPSDSYTVEVSLEGFKTFKRTGVTVTAGDRFSMGTVAMVVGGIAESVTVRSEAPLVQTASGERSYTATENEIENLPMAHRSFTQMSLLAPGVVQSSAGSQGASGTARIGGVPADNNYVMDGSSTMDTGSNRPLIQVTTESIAEVKVLVSGYQAEYGRSAGLQIIGTTKSGTNQFRGGIYDIERNSKWNATSKTLLLNGDPKPVVRQRDVGYSIGGPVGKPGGNNKLFFFHTTDFGPRTQAGVVTRFRVPSALERSGDFSQSRDNNGNLYNLIKDPSSTAPCTATNTAGCFRDGGVVGRIPANRLDTVGMQILNWYPAPNIDPIPEGQAYNLESTMPEQNLVSWQPTFRLDYQAKSTLRLSYKYQRWTQQNKIILGTVPGFNDSTQARPGARIQSMAVNYTVNPTTFIEASLGVNRSTSTGCPLNSGGAGTGAEFCQAGTATSPYSNQLDYFPGLRPIYPDANVIPSGSYAQTYYGEYVPERTPFYVDGRLQLPPSFAFGSRVAPAPPGIPNPNSQNRNESEDLTISLTKVAGRHTIKAGFYHLRSFKVTANTTYNGSLSFAHDTVGTNPFDTSFGFANAAIGTFSSYSQPDSMSETNGVFFNREAYVQDNWKLNNKLTVDYGMRFVHQTAVADTQGRQSNWDSAKWDRALAPRLFVPGCATGVYPCTGTTRQAMDPSTGQFMGTSSSILIGTVVPGSGVLDNGVVVIPANEHPYKWPYLGYAPRLGAAYDLTGNQRYILRGGGGLFFIRNTGSVALGANNPPLVNTTTYRYSQLATLGGLSPIGAPTYAGSQDQKLPSSTQWNANLQAMLPWSVLLDVGYQGIHNFNGPETFNYNTVDLGAAYLPENQDRTLAVSAVPGATALPAILYRSNPFPGATNANVIQNGETDWSTTHTLPIAFTRRFQNGFSLGFNDNITLSNKAKAPLRFEHRADGTLAIRADQQRAQELFGGFVDRRHIFKGNFVWDLPDWRNRSSLVQNVVGAVINDWQFSGVWTGSTGPRYDVGYSYTSNGTATNLTGGGANITPRVIRVTDTSSGCSSNLLAQFDTSAYQGPGYFSDGLESGQGYLTGCRQSVFDMAVARLVGLGGARRLSIRVDIFNLFNEARITGRNTTMQLASPLDPANITNLPYDAAGNVVPARSVPRGAGFGVANNYQAARTVQINLRFSY